MSVESPASEDRLYGRQQTIEILKECEVRIAEHAATSLLQECAKEAINCNYNETETEIKELAQRCEELERRNQELSASLREQHNQQVASDARHLMTQVSLQKQITEISKERDDCYEAIDVWESEKA
jgi:uncharacterized protein YecE (DUF72 family)